MGLNDPMHKALSARPGRGSAHWLFLLSLKMVVTEQWTGTNIVFAVPHTLLKAVWIELLWEVAGIVHRHRKDGKLSGEASNRLGSGFFWLHWIFTALRRLSLVVVSRGYSSLWCTSSGLQ